MNAQLDTSFYLVPHPARDAGPAVLRAVPESPRRPFAIRPDSRTPDPWALAGVWEALMQGALRVHSTFSTPGRLGLRLAVAAEARALPLRTRRLMEQALTVSAQKVVGLDEGLAPSTVALLLHHGLNSVGLACLPSRVPFLVAAAAAAAVSVEPIQGLERWPAEGCHTVVTLHHPSEWLRLHLSPGEAHVAALRTEGLSHAEIAELRESSRRTVANQLGSAYRKLKVSGRLELMNLLIGKYRRGAVPPPCRNHEAPVLENPATLE